MDSATTYISELFKDMIQAVFPDLCVGCIKNPKTKESIFCPDCLIHMPFTDHFNLKNNKVVQHFWGRININHGAALLVLREGNVTSKMVHGLKYKGRYETGFVLGQLAGKKMLESKYFEKPDIIIPVPISKRKKSIRGYNQSAVFGKGLCDVTSFNMMEENLIKVTETMSQTGKSRTQRVENVSATFQIVKPEMLKNKNVLLLDDVVTTGATLEACCIKLIESGVDKISILTIAIAE